MNKSYKIGLVGCLWFKSHRHRGHLETAPPFAVSCEGREAWFLHRSHRETSHGLKKFRERAMSDREPTRWQHNRIYPHPIDPCVYTYDLICHLQISI